MPQRSNKNRSKSSSGSSRADQPLMSQWTETAKERPFTSAAAAAGAVAAGVFLWSKRNQISDQISRLSDQITDWADEMRSGSSSRELAMTEGPNESSAIESSRATASRRSSGAGKRSSSKSRASSGRSTRTMGEIGGGNASIGAHSGTTGTGAGA